METHELKNGLNHTIMVHEIVSTIKVRCYGANNVLENVVKHVFNGMFGVKLNTVL